MMDLMLKQFDHIQQDSTPEKIYIYYQEIISNLTPIVSILN